jgi:hypothetical protein
MACQISAAKPTTSGPPRDMSTIAALFCFAVGVAAFPEARSASTLVPVAVGDEAEAEAGADPTARDRDTGFGHGFSYTYCSAFPLQVLALLASYVPLEYIQHVPEEYGERSSVRGLKTT